ncbi:hypothetical protein F0U44_12825 [Nocardioides humilatus]|uniref:LppX_LprAFG lipoprotein n=1 Tax=Nocardioides humilatus TaxID=2607660 RepID=A0A5B1LHP3_9ACTN|nr:hypothetical protein [Nocardioides humilatus]KAA1419320.1 hypothetical protein F0U44_12825 [Nocardioides humilatus]
MRRWAAAAPVLALLVLGISACDDDSVKPDTLPRPEDATKGEAVDVDAFLDELRGSFDNGATARVTFDVAGQARLRGHGVVAYGEDGMDVDLQLSDWQVKGAEVDLRTIDESTYMKVPESRGLWVDVSAGGDPGLAGSVLEDADPRNQLDTAADTITEVRYLGDQQVEGGIVRRYQVVEEADATTAATSTGPAVTEYWFDADGQVVRRTVDLGASGTATFTWADWGAPVDIAPPPDDETVTVRELERLRKQQDRPHR